MNCLRRQKGDEGGPALVNGVVYCVAAGGVCGGASVFPVHQSWCQSLGPGVAQEWWPPCDYNGIKGRNEVLSAPLFSYARLLSATSTPPRLSTSPPPTSAPLPLSPNYVTVPLLLIHSSWGLCKKLEIFYLGCVYFTCSLHATLRLILCHFIIWFVHMDTTSTCAREKEREGLMEQVGGD